MLAFLNKTSVKRKYLSRVRKHRKADQLVQGYGYWYDGNGCAIGCTLHGDKHSDYETELGIPERIAYLEDAIFEGLPVEKAKLWPEQFLSAIRPGADLSLVWNHFAVWLLRDSEFLTITDINREAISAVIALHVRSTTGDAPSSTEWESARARLLRIEVGGGAAAWAAVESARSAAWAARSARAATRSARSARSAAYAKMADKLLELLATAK